MMSSNDPNLIPAEDPVENPVKDEDLDAVALAHGMSPDHAKRMKEYAKDLLAAG